MRDSRVKDEMVRACGVSTEDPTGHAIKRVQNKVDEVEQERLCRDAHELARRSGKIVPVRRLSMNARD